jgi:hypothetical protein
MKKVKKSRVENVGVLLFKGVIDIYYLTVPYDKKNRVIPSSVECAYNSRYFTPQQTVNMLRAL